MVLKVTKLEAANTAVRQQHVVMKTSKQLIVMQYVGNCGRQFRRITILQKRNKKTKKWRQKREEEDVYQT